MGRGRGNRDILLGKNSFQAVPKDRKFVLFKYIYEKDGIQLDHIQAFKGTYTEEDLDTIGSRLDFGFFVPSYVGLPGFNAPAEDPWHSLSISEGITNYTAERFETIESVGDWKSFVELWEKLNGWGGSFPD